MFVLGLIIGAVIVSLIMHRYMSSKLDTAKAQSEQEYKHLLKCELAPRDAKIAEYEKRIVFQDERLKKVDKLTQWASWSLRNVTEREHDLARQELDLEQREQLLHRDLEAIIDYRVDSQLAVYTKNKEKGIDDNWVIIKRKTRVLEETAQKMLKRAIIISEHLGVPLERILKPGEKKLIEEISRELTDFPG